MAQESGKPRRILDNAGSKIAEYNKYDSEQMRNQYNSAYQKVLKARQAKGCLVDENGDIDMTSLRIIDSTLRSFKMANWKAETGHFVAKLKEKLGQVEMKSILRSLQSFTVYSPRITEAKTNAEMLFNALSSKDFSRNSADRFCVGATKMMNFIFPDLFVITDTHVQKAIFDRSLTDFDFDLEWRAMRTCANELSEWEAKHGSLQSLLELDAPLTTLTRLFDKCAFIMGKR